MAPEVRAVPKSDCFHSACSASNDVIIKLMDVIRRTDMHELLGKSMNQRFPVRVEAIFQHCLRAAGSGQQDRQHGSVVWPRRSRRQASVLCRKLVLAPRAWVLALPVSALSFVIGDEPLIAIHHPTSGSDS